jgi:hypothetical protein
MISIVAAMGWAWAGKLMFCNTQGHMGTEQHFLHEVDNYTKTYELKEMAWMRRITT